MTIKIVDSNRDGGNSNGRYVAVTWDGEYKREQIQSMADSQIGTLEDNFSEWCTEISNDNSQTSAFLLLDTKQELEPDVSDYESGIQKYSIGICGFCVYTVGSSTWVDDYLGIDDYSFYNDKTDSIVGLVHIICLSDGYHGYGIGSEMTRVSSDRIEKIKIDVDSIVTAVVTREKHNRKDARRMFERCGFENLYHDTSYYDKIGEYIPCADCNGSCSCGIAVLRMNISPTQTEV